MKSGLDIVVCGLSLTSSWGNGHATTYRALLKALAALGHRIRFLERDVPWYRDNRDLPAPSFCKMELYESLSDLQSRFEPQIARADAIIIGSYVPEGVALGRWIADVAKGPVCFYDIDTPITLAKLAAGDYEYISPDLVRRYDRYFSFTGGPMLRRIEDSFGSPRAQPLYCSVDVSLYHPLPSQSKRWLMGYLGTYSRDRQPTVDALLNSPARTLQEERFVIAGPGYPPSASNLGNLEIITHLPPAGHSSFYNSQQFTLNVTRAEMLAAGFSPSVRLFEAGACAVPIISDYWDGIESVFRIGSELLIAHSTDDCLRLLRDTRPDERSAIGQRARSRILAEHTSIQRAQQLEEYLLDAVRTAGRQRRHVLGYSAAQFATDVIGR